MAHAEQLQEMTEEFLLTLISEISGSPIDASKISSPFQELGIDSFHVLQVVKKLESHFGTLSKTLLFENFTVKDLAHYFVLNHKPKLIERFKVGSPAESPKPSTPSLSKAMAPEQTAKVEVGSFQPSLSDAGRPILILEQVALVHPQLGPLVANLFRAHKNEGSVSRGTRIIAPNLFLGGARRGFFNYGRCGNILLAYAYTGPEEYFPELAQELIQHCRAKNFELNLFTDNRIEAIGSIPFSATPFGAVQRILDLDQFTLQGGKMRRLRYQVSKFEEKGACKTEEYRCGTEKETDRQIADIIDKWCSGKTMVNPLIHTVKQEILDGKLTGDHRIFLTYLNGVMQNAILISPMSHEAKSYLMDLEFYPKEMPLGGLEFAIANIIEILRAENSSMLSLGATFGVKIAPSDNADPKIESILDRLREKNLFNDEGNLQFKNKFRTENKSIFLCRSAEGSNPDNVTDIIMMIADPGRSQISDQENHTPIREILSGASGQAPHAAASSLAPEVLQRRKPENSSGDLVTLAGKARSAVLADAGFNPQNIPASLIEFDLRTDSWSQLESPFVRKQMRFLQANVQQPADTHQNLKQVFPFKYLSLTQSGRTAERAFYQAWERKGEILENPLFPTTIFHQIDSGFAPKELAHPKIFESDCIERYRGGLDWELLREKLARDSGSIAMVCVELSDNGAGGYPVSLDHLRKVKALLETYSIPLVLDGTRILENALSEEKAATGDATGLLWETAREFSTCAHAVVASLTKDFCIAKGGIIATDDASLYQKIESIISREGLGLDPVEKRQVGLALQNAKLIETRVRQRMENVRLLWEALAAAGIPLLKPAGTHCVVIDVQRMEEFRESPFPVASFLAWLFLHTGIRAGALSTGLKKTPAANGLVRLAVPVGMSRKEVEELAASLASAFRMKTDIPILAADAETASPFGDIHTRYALRQYNQATSALVSRSQWGALPMEKPAGGEAPVEQAAPAERETRSRVEPGPSLPDDIAVIGMAGRYPKAANLDELWENLLQRRDCIEELPQSRLAQRQDGAKKYRGGFLADIDRFDSLFFNISPREAEIMDPQERLFLEVAWEALEDGGYFPEALGKDESSRNVGVFVGAVWTMYQVLSAENNHSASEPVHANSFLWSIANRVSYWMNFTGPSLTLDTACSSSLTALHLACEALKRGECSSAIVGGVNLDLHQHKFDINSGGGALSKDGVCRSFGKGANGYVAGEGVGAILLKPLQAAIRDRDNIHGIIKSIAVNHGGKTGGYTVPSPNSQADLIASALRKAQIDARSIGYVEAHGTGTALGDPIEISGLNKAFATYGAAPLSCAIGSVKTNIGHLEAAAGIVGVSKALLQMKHRTLVPSLHSKELNEHIDFAQSPFYVEQEVEEFRAKEVDAVRYPLRSGLSSYGAGGANAHVILEEFPSARVGNLNEDLEGPVIFPLSARSEAQLAAMAKRLRDFIQKDLAAGESSLNAGIQDIAYTLQMGRKSFDFRLAILALSKRDLVAKLESFLAGKSDRQIMTGRIKANEGIVKLLNREEREEFVRLVTRNGDPNKLAQIWVEGLIHSWQTLEAGKGNRISLPTYPFADERHWIRRSAKPPSSPSVQASTIHPLLHRNESDLYQQRYVSEFNGGETFLSPLVIRGQSFLSPFIYLEMARAAILHASSAAAGDIRQRLKNLAWNGLAPGGSAFRVAISLAESRDGLDWEIEDRQAEDAPSLSWGEAEIGPLPPGKKIDLPAICKGMEAAPLARESLARHLAEWGIEFAKGSQCVASLLHSGDQLVATLQGPEDIARPGFILNPSLLEGALQSALWLLASRGHSSRMPLLPIAIECLDIHSRIPDHASAHVRLGKPRAGLSAASTGADNQVAMIDMDICDQEGNLCVSIRGMALAQPQTPDSLSDSLSPGGNDAEEAESVIAMAATPVPTESPQELLFSETWEEIPQGSEPRSPSAEPSLLFIDEEIRARLQADREFGSLDQKVWVLPGDGFLRLSDREFRARPGSSSDLRRVLASACSESEGPITILYAWSQGKGRQGVHDLFQLFQALRETKSPVQEIILAGRYDQSDPATCWDYSWIGFERSLAMHFPSMQISILLSDDAASLPKQVREVSGRSGIYWYRRSKGQKLAIQALQKVEPTQASLLKQNGAYLITGGSGVLGFHFAKHLATQYGARLLLLGRRGMSPELEEKLAELRAAGAHEAHYLSLDLGSESAVRDFASQIPFPLSGVFHAAGIESPKLFHEKSEQEIDAVLAPKTTGTLLLDEALECHPLDFVSYFSSSSAVLGDGGACDYAVANRFLMAHALYREQKAERRGKTAVVNWPLWKDGGMGIPDPAKMEFYLKSSGQALLEKDTGLRIWHDLLASEIPQALLLIGDAKRLTNAVQRFYQPKQPLLPAAKPSALTAAAAITALGRGWKPRFEGLSLRGCILWDVKRLVSAQLRIAVERLDIDTVLTDYGFESIGLAEFAQKLSEHFAVQVTPDVFFTYTTLAQLSDYFQENHSASITAFYQRPDGRQSVGPRQVTPSFDMTARSATATAKASASSSGRRSPSASPKKSRFKRMGRAEDSIAIVGMAGRFPGAKNINELWTLLSEGRSAMRDVPRERWDWRDYFKAPGHPENKTTTNKGGFISGAAEFDAAFFGFGREEADWTDPGQRLLLMEAYHAIEDAGIRPASLRGKKVGVYVGMEESQYGLFADGLANEHVLTTNGSAMISSRLSYCLDLRGPAISVNTACSSGLVALHQAAMAIRNGDCEAALVGAIALLLTPATFIAMGATGMLSPDGQCYSLGNRDDGMGMGEAVAVVMLKPLAAAQADGDNIYGVLRASGINFDGKTNGITAPNGRAQSDLLETVYRSNGIPIDTLDVIATHSTGTKLGDSIELNALGRAMRNLAGEFGPLHPDRPSSCLITSNKGNLGHTLAASGLVSVIALLKGMRNRAIPASLNCEIENEYVAWKEMPFRINKATHPWIHGTSRPRLAAASSFGRSGTNAHVVLEECSPAREHVRFTERALIPLSAKTPAALEEKIRDLAMFLKLLIEPENESAGMSVPTAIRLTPASLAEIAYTMQVGRDSLEERAAILVDSIEDLIAKLDAYGAESGSAAGWHRANAKEHRQHLSLLAEDRAIQATVIEKWIQDGNYSRLLDSWTKGMDIDWTRLYAGAHPRKISLPGYPFARHRHWIDRPETSAIVQIGNGIVISSPALQDPSPTPTATEAAGKSKTQYLFLKPGENGTHPAMALDIRGKAELFVQQSLANQLGIDPDSVELDSEMADTGITSKDMVQITMDIKERLDASFVPTAFFDCTTTRSFAHVLAAKNSSAFQEMAVCRSGPVSASEVRASEASGHSPATVSDAAMKSGRDPKTGLGQAAAAGPSLPLHVQDAAAWEKISIPQDLPRDWSNPRAVFLTGATGYLGIHLLAELLHAQEDLRIYCLVRAEDAEQGVERIRAKARTFRLQLDMDRVAVFCGDITKPNLGLSEDEWEFCCREIQQIVHSSAHVNHIEGYAPFRPSTQAMREVIRMASRRRLKLIHFISSIAACTFFDGKQVSIHEKEEFIDDGHGVFGGYGQSKWVQETLLRNAHAQGLPFMIYRFGELGGSSRTGLAQTEDMVHRLVQMRLSLGVREKISNDVLDMLPVDFAARVVARACHTENIRNKILHATHPRPCPMASFYAFAGKQGYAFQPVSRADYLSKCLEYIRYVASFNPVDAFILECVVMREVNGLARNMRAMDGYFVILFPFDQSNFLDCLEAERLELPPWEELLERVFRNWNGIDKDYFAKILGFSKWQESQDEDLYGPQAGPIPSGQPEQVV